MDGSSDMSQVPVATEVVKWSGAFTGIGVNGIPDKAIQLLEDRSRRSGNVVMKPFISFKPDAVDCCKGHKAFEIPCGSCIFDIQPN
ncbi:hypothetical protein F2Q70_00045522 [Brassica cretica]|uniref:Uncharacterized protein n=1 Tax=Brassica cretica TaxID=69181 RepID=A0A8S9KKF1_BRACR|nr:hypothetical protein F2Q70_00045522 [Brassica cretica]